MAVNRDQGSRVADDVAGQQACPTERGGEPGVRQHPGGPANGNADAASQFPATTHGTAADSATRNARRTPPSAPTDSTATSADSASGERNSSAASVMDWSTAIRTPTRRRTTATSSRGCGRAARRIPRRPAARPVFRIADTAVSMSHWPLTSQRIVPYGPGRRVPPRAGRGHRRQAVHRTAAVRQPESATIVAAQSPGSTAGTLTATGRDRAADQASRRCRPRWPPVDAGPRQHVAARRRTELTPALWTFDEHALADGPPTNRVDQGMANTGAASKSIQVFTVLVTSSPTSRRGGGTPVRSGVVAFEVNADQEAQPATQS